MKRLIEEESHPDSADRWLAELVRATPPLQAAPFRRQRVLVGVKASARRRPRSMVRVGVGVLLLSGAAAATVGVERSWTSRAYPEKPVLQADSQRPLVVAPGPVAPGPGSADAPPVISADALPLASASSRAVVDPPSAKLRSVARSPAPAHFSEGEDPAPVLEAIRALRTNGDPARASALLAGYLKVHPQSVLAEDALALSIEAAASRRDARSAGELSRRYLAQFPNGRYRSFALRFANP